MIRRKTSDQWRQAFDGVDVCCSIVATLEEATNDPHVAARNMLVEMPRPDGSGDPVVTPGNPVKMSAVADGPESRVPWLGEHTDIVLREELGLTDDELAELRGAGAIA